MDDDDRTVYLWFYGVAGSKALIAEICRVCDEWIMGMVTVQAGPC